MLFMKHVLRLVNYYKNILLTITTNIFTFATDFLPHTITTVARTGRRIDHTSSDEGL